MLWLLYSRFIPESESTSERRVKGKLQKNVLSELWLVKLKRYFSRTTALGESKITIKSSCQRLKNNMSLTPSETPFDVQTLQLKQVE